ncbi:uncharacterized protein LOC131015848 isoform X2 [Salvia miltiorrhiza]|uniref:uncharacterized protein LOC131015848 isoform X2 n=1 Tax=Salvia miltiorrhiza TaxID=226208 RepID=UPI0025AC1CCB|nr:uncharacterized protein LOC131015848 isoform X2 [Salvia miltiorrhiza]
MAVVMTASLSAVRSEATTAGNGAPAPENQKPPPPRPRLARPFLSVSKPTWIVRTESNVRKERIAAPVPACVVCRGSGRVDCYNCNGRGRTNEMEMTMLPKGEWPKWSCGGSGLAYCARCVGTGEYRYIMGFHFMNKDAHLPPKDNPTYHRRSSHTFTDLLLNTDSDGQTSLL